MTGANSRSQMTTLAFGMIELEGDDTRIEARIDRVQHGARHRHPVMGLDHGRGIGEHDRDGVADADAARGQRRGEPAGARVKGGVGEALRAMDDSGVVRVHGRGARQERQRAERLIVGGAVVEVLLVRIAGHGGIISARGCWTQDISALRPSR